MDQWTVAAFYRFAPIEDPSALQNALRHEAERLGISGTMIVAAEGVNGTVAGSRGSIDALLAYLRSHPGLEALEHKESVAVEAPFHRLRVRLKAEIVTLGQPGIDPNERVGTYVSAEDWNALIDDPEVLVLDTRNDYEVRIGTFQSAVDPELDSFRDFSDWVDAELDAGEHKKVAMFCTGGIRCEKASALLLNKGFGTVYHLKGGILKYLERVPEQDSRWNGECFVFDGRVAVKHGLQEGTHAPCYGCKEPLGPEDRQSSLYEEGVTCPFCAEQTTEAVRSRRRERARQVRLAQTKGETHIGDAAFSSQRARRVERGGRKA